MLQDNIYCKISVIPNNCICAEFNLSNHYILTNMFLRVMFKSSSYNSIVKLIDNHVWISSTLSVGHALYIGGELVKAELALITSQEYVQD